MWCRKKKTKKKGGNLATGPPTTAPPLPPQPPLNHDCHSTTTASLSPPPLGRPPNQMLPPLNHHCCPPSHHPCSQPSLHHHRPCHGPHQHPPTALATALATLVGNEGICVCRLHPPNDRHLCLLLTCQKCRPDTSATFYYVGLFFCRQCRVGTTSQKCIARHLRVCRLQKRSNFF